MLFNYGKKSIKKTRKGQGLLKYLVVNVQWERRDHRLKCNTIEN